MKKPIIALSLLIFVFTGCEKDYDKVINPSTDNLVVEQISKHDSLDYGIGDSILNLQIKISPQNLVTDVKAALNNPFGQSITALSLFDNGDLENADSSAGDGIYSNKIQLDNENPSGNYSIFYFVNGKKAAVQFFFFENGAEKFPPVISELVFKDSVMFDETFTFSVLAVDANGAEDIERVFYEVFRPDGSQIINSTGISKFPMFDDGNPAAGDVTAGDSIYTQKLTFPSNVPTVPPGRYRFEIAAEDRSRRLSNRIIHFLEVN